MTPARMRIASDGTRAGCRFARWRCCRCRLALPRADMVASCGYCFEVFGTRWHLQGISQQRELRRQRFDSAQHFGAGFAQLISFFGRHKFFLEAVIFIFRKRACGQTPNVAVGDHRSGVCRVYPPPAAFHAGTGGRAPCAGRSFVLAPLQADHVEVRSGDVRNARILVQHARTDLDGVGKSSLHQIHADDARSVAGA